MSQQSPNVQHGFEQEQEKATLIKRNRFFAILIILIVAAPMVAAYIMFQTGWGVSLHTTNKGELINPPLPISALTLASDSQSIQSLVKSSSSAKKWRLLVLVDASCDDICQKNLYTTRQVHIRLAEKAYRVERVILSISADLPAVLEKQLADDHPNTQRIIASEQSLKQWLSAAGIQENAREYYYLVDQEGFAMMRYNTSHTGQDLLDDIKKLLKFTYDK
ncbi:SCO family protein [Eionea flava]